MPQASYSPLARKTPLVKIQWFAALSLSFFSSVVTADWFETFKDTATDSELHQLLYEMPKGGDLHHHLTGSVLPEWWYEAALNVADEGYRFYTKVRINNCMEHGEPEFMQYLIHYRNIHAFQWEALSECEKTEYLPLHELSDDQRDAWMNAVMLDKPHEGREEFFGKHWPRLGAMTSSPPLLMAVMLRHFQAFADEGLIYVEPQVPVLGFASPDGTPIQPNEVADYMRELLKDEAFSATGLTWRFQMSILRMLPTAEDDLRMAYQFVSENDPWVAVNMVGREDDDKGYPRRFLPVAREMRHAFNNVRLSIHGGEVDEPNDHVRDTLLMGADRIGHGLNLITDDDAMRLMRYGPYMVEINLISNLLLEYVSDYSQHPFPEYLRIGIPVALSTDDRGMWHSTMTDEFFVGVKEFDLSWPEIRLLSESSIRYSFLPDAEKTALLETLEQRLDKFEKRVVKKGVAALQKNASPRYRFVCRRYQLCADQP